MVSVNELKPFFNLLCPIFPEELVVRGYFGHDYFAYVEIEIKGCDLGDKCISDVALMKKSWNYIDIKSLPSLLNPADDKVVSYSPD